MDEIPEHEIRRLAKLFLHRFGDSATSKLVGKAEEFRQCSNFDGVRICRQIIRAIEELIDLEPGSVLRH